MPIPRIIHQMWRDEVLPVRWAAMCETWKRHHPGWEYRFWTDEMLRAFVAEHYSDFLEVYDGFGQPVMRSDAARYLLLEHFGGVYADLDMECLRNVEDLVAGKRLLLPLELLRWFLSGLTSITRICCRGGKVGVWSYLCRRPMLVASTWRTSSAC
jgi:mannosyltransferase OCH1-like enzyme